MVRRVDDVNLGAKSLELRLCASGFRVQAVRSSGVRQDLRI